MFHTKQIAFTLVELIVVVTILAILATIGFVSYSSYLTGVRDTNRIAQMTSLSDGLNLYSTTNDLPIPEDNVEILAGTDLVAYQGYAGANILETINFTKGGLDPKDNTYFSYYLTRDRKYFQLMGFLEESSDLTTSINLSDQAKAVNYQDRIPTVAGKKLGILTDTDNIPIQEDGTNLDLLNSGTEEFNMHVSNDEVYSVTGPSVLSTYALKDRSLVSLDETLVGYYNFNDCTADDSSNLANHGILNQSPKCVTAKKGKGYSFNGLNQYVIIPKITELEFTGEKFSYGFWVNISSNDVDGGYIIGKPWNGSGQYNYTVLIDGTGWVQGNSTVQLGYNGGLKKDEWQHMFVTLDGSVNEMSLYIDGKKVYTNSFQSISSWNPSSGNSNLNLALMTLFPYGSSTNVPTLSVEGLMDEVYIYNRALTEYEIGIIYRK